MYCLGKREYNRSYVVNLLENLSLHAQQVVVLDVTLPCLCVYNSPFQGKAEALVLLF